MHDPEVSEARYFSVIEKKTAKLFEAACQLGAVLSGETRFACVEGPEFNGHQVDFDELMTRLAYYQPEEKSSLEQYHRCRMEEAADNLQRSE